MVSGLPRTAFTANTSTSNQAGRGFNIQGRTGRLRMAAILSIEEELNVDYSGSDRVLASAPPVQVGGDGCSQEVDIGG